MPEISKIKLVLNQEEDETYEVKDTEVRNVLDVLLGVKDEEDSSEE